MTPDMKRHSSYADRSVEDSLGSMSSVHWAAFVQAFDALEGSEDAVVLRSAAAVAHSQSVVVVWRASTVLYSLFDVAEAVELWQWFVLRDDCR